MGYKDPNKRRETQKRYQAKYYENNKAKHISAVAIQNERKREWFRELKAHPCTDCGVSYPYYVMDFDHITDDKEINPSAMINHGWSKERILKELEKCELVCSNCHRIRTHERRSGLV